MQLTTLGPRVTKDGVALATLSLTPLFDRAAIVTDILITNPSANDTWTVVVGGREIARHRILTVGNQHLSGKVGATAPPTHGWMAYCRQVLGVDPSIPVPNGVTMTVSSVGGATADILILFKEVQPTDTPVGMANHYQGNHFILPLYGSLAAAQAAAGAVALDTSIRPGFVPDIWTGAASIPPNWQLKLLALFLEGGGVNTFNGAANHASITRSLNAVRDGQTMFNRDGGGLTLVGSASAAGSANTVFNADLATFPPFDEATHLSLAPLDTPIVVSGGDAIQWLLALTGDLTGGASYANMLQVAIADVVLGA